MAFESFADGITLSVEIIISNKIGNIYLQQISKKESHDDKQNFGF